MSGGKHFLQFKDFSREEFDYLFERTRRITGYLVGSVDRFNNAKRSEERDRVKHGLGGYDHG